MKHPEIKSQSTDRLRGNFITSDYKGRQYQEESFREYMRREWWKFWKHLW